MFFRCFQAGFSTQNLDMNNQKPRETGGQRGCNLLIFVDMPCRSAQLRGRLGSALLTCEWDGSCEVARGYRMGLWAYASSLNTPCPQDIAPIRATILMASQTEFPDIVPTLRSTPLSYPMSHKKSPRSDHFNANYVPILMAGGPGLKI